MESLHSLAPPDRELKLALANRLYREFYARCFWHMKPDLEVTAELLPLIIDGLRRQGGKAGLLAAEQLAQRE